MCQMHVVVMAVGVNKKGQNRRFGWIDPFTGRIILIGVRREEEAI
jgi:hypothetical protein